VSGSEGAAPSTVRRLVLVVPEDLEAASGGNRYDSALARALTELGTEVEQRPAAGRWPTATAGQQDRLAELLTGPDPVLVDGLLACSAPAAVRAAVGSGVRVHVLVHLPLALETGLSVEAAAAREALERQALRAATGVLATSRWAAQDLNRRHGLDRVAVAVPGTDPAPAAAGSRPPLLLQLASVTPRKDQLTVVRALAQLPELAWQADLTGPLENDPAYVTRVRQAIEQHGLAGRVRLTGPRGGPDLEAAWNRTNLLLLPSHAETWGMVVTEALARGIPAVVGRGTGAQEALGRAPDGSLPGAIVPPGDPGALAAALRELLGAGGARAADAARARGQELNRWQDTARDVLEAVR
jgi:glycosyltransferase involved in cell wall biosynthesis